jgi:serine protease DegQ
MKNKLIAFAVFAVMAGAFEYMRPHNTMPSDLRDGVADFSTDEDFTSALRDIKTKGTPTGNLDIRLVRVKSDARGELAQIVAKVRPSVVKVETKSAIGSGFIVDPSGIVATNAHVIGHMPVGGIVSLHVEGMTEEQKGVVLALGSPEKRDIAFVKILAAKNNWSAITLKHSFDLNIGDRVLALGYPHGLPFTMTSGTISSDPHPREYYTAVQTEAPINPGNSGGPLLAMDGTVVGMNTFIFTKGGGNEGLGFAIASEEIYQALRQYLKLGHIKTSSLGAIISLQREVKAMLPESAAEKAGIMSNDVIVSINGRKIPDTDSFLKQLRAFMPGDKVLVGVLRKDKPIELSVILEAEREMPLMRLAASEAGLLPG